MKNWLEHGVGAVWGGLVLAGLALPVGCSGGDDPAPGWNPGATNAGGATAAGEGSGGNASGGGGGGGGGAQPVPAGGQPANATGDQPAPGQIVGGGCDDALTLDSLSALDAARAIGLCPEALGSEVVLDSAYTLPDGSGEPGSRFQWGLVQHMGPTTPLEGERMLLLSTGVARDEADGLPPGCTIGQLDPEGQDRMGPAFHPAPPGFPKYAPRPDYCLPFTPLDLDQVRNAAALHLRLRAPQGAVGLRFAANYFTMGFPGGICQGVDASFVALMDPAPPGAIDGNIAFDSTGQAIGLGYELLRVCDPGTYAETYLPVGASSTPHMVACDRGGIEQLAGTGYDYACSGPGDSFSVDFQSPDPQGRMAGSSTGWLRISAPVVGGAELTLRFAIWQSINDPSGHRASVLFDDFQWVFDDVVTTGTEYYPQ